MLNVEGSHATSCYTAPTGADGRKMWSYVARFFFFSSMNDPRFKVQKESWVIFCSRTRSSTWTQTEVDIRELIGSGVVLQVSVQPKAVWCKVLVLKVHGFTCIPKIHAEVVWYYRALMRRKPDRHWGFWLVKSLFLRVNFLFLSRKSSCIMFNTQRLLNEIMTCDTNLVYFSQDSWTCTFGHFQVAATSISSWKISHHPHSFSCPSCFIKPWCDNQPPV